MRLFKNFTPKTCISFDGTKIYYEIQGDTRNKKIMLFLHGLGGNVTAWDPYCEYFGARGYTTITVDLRGHGFSGRPKGEKAYTLENLAKDVLMILKIHQLQDIVLVGQCIGGMVATILVGTYGVQPKTLLLIGTGYKIPTYISLLARPQALSLLYGALNKLPPSHTKPTHANLVRFRGTNTIDLRRFTSDVLHCTAQSYVGICSNLFSFDGSSLLPKITCPTLIIHGTRDIIFPKATATDLHRHIKNSQLVFVPGANHILVINNSEEIITIIGKYLARSASTFSQRVFLANPV